MAKQTFTTGDVLTASAMTSLQNTAMLGGAANGKTANYTLVAADAGTLITMSNAGATTITVNTGLFSAGDTVTILNIGAGTCTITAGTATVSKPTNATLALVTNAGGVLYFTATGAAIFMPFDVGTTSTGKSFSLLNSGGTALTGSTTITVSSLSGYDQFYVLISGASTTGSPYPTISLRLNSDTGNNYYSFGWQISAANTYASSIITGNEQNPASSFRLAQMSDNAASLVHGGFFINGANTAGLKMISGTGGGTAGGGEGQLVNSRIGYYNSSSVISSISLFSSSGNFDAGTMYVYGAV